MATSKEKIEHLEHNWVEEETPWKNLSYSRKWLKRQMNKFIRRKGKNPNEDSVTKFKREYKGWEY